MCVLKKGGLIFRRLDIDQMKKSEIMKNNGPEIIRCTYWNPKQVLQTMELIGSKAYVQESQNHDFLIPNGRFGQYFIKNSETT